MLASAYAGWAGSLPTEVVEERLRQILQEVVDEMATIMSAAHPAGARVMARDFAEADLRDVLPRIQVPTLLLYGDSDQRVPAQVAEDLHAKIPASRLVMLTGAGHQCNLEATERFTAKVRTFLRSV